MSGESELDPVFTAFIAAGAPHGASALRLARFREHTVASRTGAVMDDLLGSGEGDGPPAPFGLTLDWVEPQGRPLRTLRLHPIAPSVEDQLLPACVVTAFASQVPVEVVARHAALLSAPRVVDTLLPAAAPHAPGAGYREGPPAPPDGALQELFDAGFRIEDVHPASFHVVREQRRKRNLSWLFMLIPIALFAPAIVVLDRSFKGLLTMLRRVFTQALRDRTEQLRYQVQDGTLTVVAESQPGEREACEVLLREGLAVGFGPSGTPVQDSDLGVLRVVTAERCVRLVHGFALSGVNPNGGTRTSDDRVERARAEGRALRALLLWLVAAHQR